MILALSKLHDQAEIIMGQSPPGNSYNTDGMGMPLLNGPTEFGPVHPTEQQWTDAPTKLCKSGDILFCVRGATAGRTNIADKEYCLGRGLAAVRAKSDRFDSRFLHYVLAAGYARFQSQGVGSTFINISAELLSNFDVPLMPLDEQRRVAAILDQADDLRSKRRMALDRLAALGQAIFNAKFPLANLARVPLIKLANIEAGLVDPTEDQYVNLPHIAPDSIESHSGELLNYRSAGEDGVFSGKYLFDEGSILYSKIRPYLNKVALAPGKGVCSADMYVMRPIERTSTREYLWFLLRSGDFLNFAERHSGRLSIPKLNRDQMASYQAPAPSFEKQLEFSKSVTALLAVKTRHRAHLIKLYALFASLQHRAFRGEL